MGEVSEYYMVMQWYCMILHGTYCLVFLVLQSIGGESSFPLLVLNLVVLIWMECCRIKWHPTPWIGSPRSLETGKSIHQHFLMWKHFVKKYKSKLQLNWALNQIFVHGDFRWILKGLAIQVEELSWVCMRFCLFAEELAKLLNGQTPTRRIQVWM